MAAAVMILVAERGERIGRRRRRMGPVGVGVSGGEVEA